MIKHAGSRLKRACLDNLLNTKKTHVYDGIIAEKLINNSTYIIADTHFGHVNISKYEPTRTIESEKSGFSNIDDLMVFNWNKIVKPNDTIFHLGDFAFKHQSLSKLATSLNGNKILLVGNHDKPKDIEVLKECGWQVINSVVVALDDEGVTDILARFETNFRLSEKELRNLACYVCDVDDLRIMFTHFPLFNNNPYDEKYNVITEALEFLFLEFDCEINIHGHTHSYEAKEKFCVSACVELIGFEPVTLGKLVKEYAGV